MDFHVIMIKKNTIQDLNKSKKLEWLLTNGLGSYASSTILGMNTRKYHGLLIASKKPPLNRKVILSKLEEEIVFKDKAVNLSTNRYIDVIHPQGYKKMIEFELNPFPQFIYKVDDIEIKKIIFMVRGKNIVIVKYEIRNTKNKKFVLRISPFVNYRSIYSLTKSQINLKIENRKNSIKIIFPDKNYLLIKGENFKESPLNETDRWYKNFFYETDTDRREGCVENNYNPGCFEIKIEKERQDLFVVAGYCLPEKELKNPKKIITQEIRRKKKLLEDFFKRNKVPKEDWIKWLVLAADSHLITRFDKKKSIIAGYHWFGEWGRDALISLPGLCLSTGRLLEAKQILSMYSNLCKDGLIPNMLSSKNSHKSVDVSLLFIDQVYKFYRHANDKKFVEKVWPKMKKIIKSYMKGTLYEIKMDEDGLIAHGPGLTWMDAVVNDNYITPREGKAVEIQALWYNALKIMEFFARKLREDYQEYFALAKQVKKSFNEKFWNGSYLNDCLGDNSLRPNQIFAIGLDFSVLDRNKMKKILSVVKKELLTRYGLRTLSKNDPRYHGKYSGSWSERDSAYHQGTVWPWLFGMFMRSWIKVYRNKKLMSKLIKSFIEEEIMRFGLGSISEILDGDEPFESRGCISQAWSVGETLSCITL